MGSVIQDSITRDLPYLSVPRRSVPPLLLRERKAVHNSGAEVEGQNIQDPIYRLKSLNIFAKCHNFSRPLIQAGYLLFLLYCYCRPMPMTISL